MVVRAAVAAALCIVVAAACSRPLPDPDSPGATILRTRCAGCHPVYQPGSMPIAMWDQQLWHMRQVYAQRGLAWLSPEEEQTLRAYLEQHALRP